MSSIAIGYVKDELITSINDTIIDLVDRTPEFNFAYDVNVVGLAFAKRKVDLAIIGGGAPLITDEGFGPPFNPKIYMIYKTEDTYESVPLIGPLDTENEISMFNTIKYTNCLEHPPGGNEILGNFYDLIDNTVHPGLSVLDRMEHSDDESFTDFGFTFFPIENINTFLTQFNDQHLLLSGAIANFGTGLNYYNPPDKRYFTSKLEIGDTPENIIINALAHLRGAGSLSAEIIGLAPAVRDHGQASPGLSTAVDNLVFEINSIGVDIDNIDNFVNNLNAALLPANAVNLAGGQVLQSIRSARVLARNTIDQAGIIVNEIYSNLAFPDELKENAANLAIITAEFASGIIEIAMAASRASETNIKSAVRDNGGSGGLPAIDSVVHSETANIGGINLKDDLGRMKYNEIRTIRERAAAAMNEPINPDEVTEIGEPSVFVGPPCPPDWKAF